MTREGLSPRYRCCSPQAQPKSFRGLQAGFNEIQRNLGQERIDHIILLTDGHTYGDEQQCISLAEQAATQGIGISAMGIGKEWNDIFPGYSGQPHGREQPLHFPV
jgi:Ca-activated chloride channel homolog